MRGLQHRSIIVLLVPALTIGVAPASGAGQVPEPRAESTTSAQVGAWAPKRGGTIVDGIFSTSPAWDCSLQLECVAWKVAGCPAAMAGVKAASHTAIVDVADRAGTTRAFEIRRGTGESIIFGGVVVQFWRANCTELLPRWRSFYDCDGPPCSEEPRYLDGMMFGWEKVRTSLSIPRRAAWMTISANDNLNLDWALV